MIPNKNSNQEIWFVLNKIKNDESYGKGEDIAYQVCSPPLSLEKTAWPVVEPKIIKQLAQWEAIKIKEANGRKETARLLDIGYEPPQAVSVSLWYLEILQPKFDEIYRKFERNKV